MKLAVWTSGYRCETVNPRRHSGRPSLTRSGRIHAGARRPNNGCRIIRQGPREESHLPIGLRTTFAWKLVAVAVLVSAAYLVVPASHAESIKIGALEGSANSIPVELILREAYNQLGIDLEVSYFPARRSLQLANKGQFDGELQRVDGLDKITQT